MKRKMLFVSAVIEVHGEGAVKSSHHSSRAMTASCSSEQRGLVSPDRVWICLLRGLVSPDRVVV